MSEPTITLTKAQANEIREIIELFACHAVTGWEDCIGDDFTQEQFDKLKERLEKATHALGGSETYEEMAARVR